MNPSTLPTRRRTAGERARAWRDRAADLARAAFIEGPDLQELVAAADRRQPFDAIPGDPHEHVGGPGAPLFELLRVLKDFVVLPAMFRNGREPASDAELRLGILRTLLANVALRELDDLLADLARRPRSQELLRATRALSHPRLARWPEIGQPYRADDFEVRTAKSWAEIAAVDRRMPGRAPHAASLADRLHRVLDRGEHVVMMLCRDRRRGPVAVLHLPHDRLAQYCGDGRVAGDAVDGLEFAPEVRPSIGEHVSLVTAFVDYLQDVVRDLSGRRRRVEALARHVAERRAALDGMALLPCGFDHESDQAVGLAEEELRFAFMPADCATAQEFAALVAGHGGVAEHARRHSGRRAGARRQVR